MEVGGDTCSIRSIRKSLSVVGQGPYTSTAVDVGRQVSLNGTLHWEMLDVDKVKKKTVCTPCHCYSQAEEGRIC